MFSTLIIPKFCHQIPTALSTRLVRNCSTLTRVRIKQGELQGKLENLPSGNTYASFKGIPYARPPVGPLRFMEVRAKSLSKFYCNPISGSATYKAPLSPEPWNGVRDATNHGAICPQFDNFTKVLHKGSEDCLFLNVYTPNANGPPKAVMIFLFGGAYASGSGDCDVYGPEYLVDEGVVVITINYRLEILGFLSLDTKEVPGNAGLKDQVAALRWVKENVSQFGGDANNITVFGESAGAASATYHMISPMSKGLINKVIAQSGSAFSEWAISSGAKERAFRLGKLLGKETDDTNELLHYLRSLPATNLVEVGLACSTIEEKFRGFPLHFRPIVEKHFEGTECFLPKSAKQLLKDNCQKVPLLTGYNSLEGLTMIANNLKKIDIMNATFERKVPWDIVESVTPAELKKIADKVKYFYFGTSGMHKDAVMENVELESDYHINVSVLDFAKEVDQTIKNPVFLYKFCLDGDLNLMKKITGYQNLPGACHADEIYYLFKSKIEVAEGSPCWVGRKRMARMWTNFAKYGNPTPNQDDLLSVKWKPLNQKEMNFLEIDSDLKPGQYPDPERHEFWFNLRKNVFGEHLPKCHL